MTGISIKCEHKNSDEFLNMLIDSDFNDKTKDIRVQLMCVLKLVRRMNGEVWPTPIEDLDLRDGACETLKRFGIKNAGQLIAVGPFLDHVVGFGKVKKKWALKAITDFKKEQGLS